MASVEVFDETVIVVRREALAAVIADHSRWVAWWPDLEVSVVLDRGLDGMRWSVSGPLVGTSEIVLVPQDRAVLIRYVLRADPTAPGSRTAARRMPDSPRGRRELTSLQRRQAMAWKRSVWALADELGTRS